MNNLTPQTLEEMLEELAKIGVTSPRMPVFGEKPNYFVEVDFHD